MGMCKSKEQQELAAKTREIDRQIQMDKRAANNIIKLLLLGEKLGILTG